MYCQNCGNEVNDNTRFCQNCGQPINQNTKQVPKAITADAVWESYSTQVNPNYENDVIEIYEAFGWELLSSQTIDKQDTHLENSFGVINSVTEYEKYVKLTFRRNKNMPFYSQICELEKKYKNADCLSEPQTASTWMLIVGILLLPFGFLMPGFAVVGIVLLILHFRQKKKKDSIYNEYLREKETADEIKYNCIEEAKKLR